MKKIVLVVTFVALSIPAAYAADKPSNQPTRPLIAKVWDFVNGGGWAGLCDRTFGEGSGVVWRHTWTNAQKTSWGAYDACEPSKRATLPESEG